MNTCNIANGLTGHRKPTSLPDVAGRDGEVSDCCEECTEERTASGALALNICMFFTGHEHDLDPLGWDECPWWFL